MQQHKKVDISLFLSRRFELYCGKYFKSFNFNVKED